jgi:putative salt-induced outer membrane protein YdiY
LKKEAELNLKNYRHNYFFIYVLLFFVFISETGAQTIVNTEKLTRQTKKGVNFGLDINFDIEKGNSDVIQFEGNSIAGYENKNQAINLLTGLKYLSEDTNELIYRNFIHLRHNYFFTPKIRSFAFYQLQRNNSLLLNRRQLFGGGLRKIFTAADSLKIDFGSGIMYEMEKLSERDTIHNEGINQAVFRMANVMSIIYRLKSGLSISDALYFQPDISNFDDFRFLNEVTIGVSLNKYLQLTVSSVWRYDSKPPLKLESNDINIQTGLTFRFNRHH